MPVPEPHAKKLLVMGWCGDIQDLVDSLNMFAPGKTVVTVLCDCCPEVSASMCQASNPKISATVQCDCLPRGRCQYGLGLTCVCKFVGEAVLRLSLGVHNWAENDL